MAMVKTNKVPDALRLDKTDDGLGQQQFVSTEIIEPTAGWGQKQVSFLLPTTGIMDKDSFITFRIQAASAAVHLPLWAGAMSAIETATLYGPDGTQICRSAGVNHLWTLKNFFRDPTDRDERQSKRLGSNTSLMVDSLAGAVNPLFPNAGKGVWGVDVAQPDVYMDAGVPPALPDSYKTTEGYKITADDKTPEWSVRLDELFPLLYQNSLPLGLLSGQCSITLDLQEEQARGQRTVAPDGTWVKGTQYYDWKLNVDLIYYDDPLNGGPTVMDELRAKMNLGTAIVFSDYAYIRQSQQPGVVGQTQFISPLLGLNNQSVRKIFCSTPEATSYGAGAQNSSNALLGNYHSLGSLSKNTLQVTLNSVPYFSAGPLDTDGKIANQLNQMYPTPFKINQAVQSAVGQVDGAGDWVATQALVTDRTMNGVSQQVERAAGHYYGVSLSKNHTNAFGNGLAVGRQPVLFELTDLRSTDGNLAKDVHIWCELERLMMIKGGKVTVSGS
jgi:hypothetical protein